MTAGHAPISPDGGEFRLGPASFLIEDLPDAVLLVDAQWRITYANTEARRRFRLDQSQDDPSLWEVMPEAIEQSREEHYRRAMNDHVAVRFEQHSPRDNAWLVVRASPATGGGLLIVLTDISNLKRSEDDLRDREDRYRLLFDRNPQPMFAYDVDTCRFVIVNDAVVTRYGYTREELLGMTIFDLHPAEELQKLRALLSRMSRSPVSASGVWHHRKKDGTVLAVDITSQGLVVAGRFVRIVVAIDVTDRLRAEEAMRASELLYRTLGEAMPLLTWSMRLDGTYDYVNTRFTEVLGLTATDASHLGWAGFVHPDDLDVLLHRWETERSVPLAAQIEVRHRMVDGSYRWYLLRGAPVVDENGNVLRWIIVGMDIDDMKRTQVELQQAKDAAEAANLAKDQFLAVLSHELRTPLTPVLLMASSLRADTDLDPEVRESLSMITEQIELEARLIDDLLDLTRITRSKFHLSMTDLDAHHVVRRAMQVCMPTIEAQNLTFGAELNATRRDLHADPARLQQLLCNLLNNAAKFTQPGGSIRLRTFNEDDGGVFAVEVADTGIGIDPVLLPRIFNAFEQGERSITRTFGGLGLGLTIGKAIAEMHGGSLTAASAGRSQGTTVTLRVPVQKERKQAPAQMQPPAIPARRVRVLIVDDHAPTLRLMTRLLRSLGHDVRAAGTAQRAIEMAVEDCPELLISDIGMPNQSGWSLLNELHRRCPPTMRAIAISGYGTDDDLQRSQEAGFIEHIVKPIDVQRLQAAIERAMKDAEDDSPA